MLVNPMFAKVLLIKCLFLAVFSVSYSRAQSFFSETNFPDSNFRAYLLENFGDLNAEEARSITFLDTPGDRGEQRGVIIDLTGVHLMTGLVTLRASYESVEKVPDLMGLNALRYIDLNANEPLNHVPKIPSGVAYLDLSSTSISDLSPILDSQLLKERDNGLSVNHTLLNNDDCGVIARLNARAQASGGHFSYSNQEFGVLDCSDALPNHRMFPHISNPDAGFTSWITLFSIGQQSADYVLHFLSSEGVIVQEETGELMNGDYVSVCPPDGAAYALVNSQIGITAFMAFKHQESRIATYLAGSSIGKSLLSWSNQTNQASLPACL